jgi:hypothetical protein
LDELGFKHSHLGFRYAAVIIAHCLKNPDDMLRISKAYRVCAQKAGTTPRQVDQALRHELRFHAKTEDTSKEFVAHAVNDVRIKLYSQKKSRKG